MMRTWPCGSGLRKSRNHIFQTAVLKQYPAKDGHMAQQIGQLTRKQYFYYGNAFDIEIRSDITIQINLSFEFSRKHVLPW